MANGRNNGNNSQNTKRRKRTFKSEKKRVGKLHFLMGLFFILLLYVGVYRIYDIKYVSGKDYENQAIYNQVNSKQDKIINPNRGAILDRNKLRLAMSSTVYNVVLDVRNYDKLKDEEKNEIINALTEKAGIEKSEFDEIVKKDSDGKLVNDTNYKIIQKQLEYKNGQEIKNMSLKCVYLEEDTKRIYPNNSLAAQTIGFIRGDSSWGLESYYNDVMTGVPGRSFMTYEADNRITQRDERPQEGYSLVTTLDQTIQQYAEKAVKAAYYEHNAENTSAIVMNPQTGEILAMASYPTFDLNSPNKLSLLEKDDYKKLWEQMPAEKQSEVSLRSWRNFNISDTFEPGSIFKPIVVAAALEEGAIKETDTYFCGGQKVYGKDTIRCHKLSGHGAQTVEQVLANSCNVGMMDIVSKLGPEKFLKYQKAFGYGQKTGIDLPGEASAEKLMYSLDQLKGNVYLATSSFGQGFNATAIQSMNAFAATINGGNLMKPYVVSQIIDKDGNIIEEHTPKVVNKVISQDTSDYLRKALESVITDTGTGKKAKIDGYAIGGKTGTAQQGKRELNIHTCSFIAYLPVENPEIMVGVFLHKPTPYIDGVSSPAPMLKEILLNIINYKAIPPSYENDTNNSVSAKNNEIVVGDYVNKNLQDVIKDFNTNNVAFEIVGNGDVVYKQSPTPNNRIDKSSKIILFAKQSDTSKELVIVPNVVGMSSAQAKSLIEGQGFVCNIVKEQQDEVSENASGEDLIEEETVSSDENQQSTNSQTDNGKVVKEQYPNAEVKIEKGSIIKIVEG